MRSACGDFALANSISERGEDKRLLSVFKKGEKQEKEIIDAGVDIEILFLSQGF
jgi:hypothetical protein